MPFISEIDVRLHKGKVGGTLLADLGYASERFDCEIWVPKGFECDFGSVPSIFQGIVPRVGRTGAAFVVHDWLYRNSGLIPTIDQVGVRLSRKDCDLIMRDAMDDLGHAWRAYIAYWGVRLGAGLTWKRYMGINHSAIGI